MVVNACVVALAQFGRMVSRVTPPHPGAFTVSG